MFLLCTRLTIYAILHCQRRIDSNATRLLIDAFNDRLRDIVTAYCPNEQRPPDVLFGNSLLR